MKRFLGLAIVLAFVAVTALICPPLSQARLIEVNLNLDLRNSVIAPGPGGGGWGTSPPGRPFLSFPKVQPVIGDSLRIRLNFVDQFSNQPQRLKISDLGIGEGEFLFGRADGDISVVALHSNSFTFHDVIGDIFLNPVFPPLTRSSGAGIAASVFANMTDTAFSFTGITWQIDFLELTYFSGDGFN